MLTRTNVDNHSRTDDRKRCSSNLNKPEGEISDEELDLVVTTLQRISRVATLEFALRVGAVIVHNFYGGSVETWRTKGLKNASFRRLAKHPRLPMSASALCRCVATFELCERLQLPSRWPHLTSTHVRLVLGLRADVQEQLLARANSEKWTVRTLEQAALRARDTGTSRGGRQPESPALKSIRDVRKAFFSQRAVVAELGQPSPRELEALWKFAEEARDYLEQLVSLLRARSEQR